MSTGKNGGQYGVGQIVSKLKTLEWTVWLGVAIMSILLFCIWNTLGKMQEAQVRMETRSQKLINQVE